MGFSPSRKYVTTHSTALGLTIAHEGVWPGCMLGGRHCSPQIVQLQWGFWGYTVSEGSGVESRV